MQFLGHIKIQVTIYKVNTLGLSVWVEEGRKVGA